MRPRNILAQLWAMAAILTVSTAAEGAEVYKVTVTRKSDDLYQVQGQKIFVKTRYCYEYVYGDEAILRIDSPGEIVLSG